METIRWGFLGCGKISSDFINASKALPNVKFVACAARSLESAQKFSKTHGISKAYGSYEQLVRDPEVDIVYIGTIHTSHFEHIMLALKHEKNVLVEKPMTMNSKQAAEAIALAKKKKLFLMEAMWTRFFPAVRHVRQLIKDGAIGEVHHVNADMGLCFPSDVERIWNRKMGGGGLLDIGVYPLAFVTMALGWKPQSVKAVGKLSEEGVDLCGSITLEYSQNRFGTVQYTCLANFSEEVTIIGSKGKIKIHPLAHTPTKITILRDGKADEIVFPVPTPAKNATSFNFSLSVGLFYEAQEVTKLLLDKKTQSSEFSLDESFALAQIMDDVRKQLGVVYDADFK